MNVCVASNNFSKTLFVLAVVLSGYLPVHAQSIPGYPDSVMAYDAREVALLPRYCTYTQLFRDHVPGGNNKQVVDQWQAQLGAVIPCAAPLLLGFDEN